MFLGVLCFRLSFLGNDWKFEFENNTGVRTTHMLLTIFLEEVEYFYKTFCHPKINIMNNSFPN